MDPRRALPGVDQVLAALSGLPHDLLVACARDSIAAARERVTRGEPGRKKIALVATAHKLARAMAAMLRSGEAWREDEQDPA